MSDLEDGQGGEGDVTQGEVTVALQDSHGVAEPVHVSADLCTGGGDDDLDAGDLSLDELNDNILDLGDNLSLEGREKQADECSGGDCGESAASDSTSKCSQSADTDPGDSDHTKAPSSGNSDQNTTPSIESLDITSPNSIVDTHVKKRNSLEVRNNIPDVNEVKNYDGDLGFDLKKMQAQGAVPKMKKKSPGLARRLADPLEIDDRDTSSSERETESALIDTSIISAQKDYESQLRNGSASILHYAPKSRVPPTDAEQCPTAIDKSSTRPDSPQDSPADPASFQPIDSPSSQPPGRRSESPEDLHRRKEASLPQRASSEPPQTNHVEAKFKLDDDAQSQDVENEYDYVKYSRIQQGDSYVGMRLAYSSSNDSLSLKRSLNMARSGSEDDQYCISSQEQSPKKLLSGGTSNNHMINDQIIRVGKVNEETLTEIPLNGNDNLLPEEQKNFSLSPEATECDSAEVESVLSDEGRSSTSGMPLVEDGLSSSQGSDTEDAPTYDMQRPAEILKRRFKAQMESELQQHPPDGMDSDGRSCSATDDNSSQMSSPSKDGQRRDEVDLALQDIQTAIQRSKGVTLKSAYDHQQEEEPVWVMRYVEPQVADSYVRKIQRHDELRQMRSAEDTPQEEELSKEKPDQVYNPEEDEDNLLKYQYSRHENKAYPQSRDFDTDEETDELLDKQYASNEKVDIPELSRPPVNRSAQAEKRRSRAREVTLRDPDDETVLIEGVLFRARYLGSTQLISEGNPSKSMRMMQAQEAVGRIKAPEGESQPSTEVDLFVSVEKIMVLNTDLQEIMMDHALRTISYIADIGDILVIMARRGPVTSPSSDGRVHKHQSKICCHVFESEEAQLIAQSMGQAFQVAYMEFLKANGIDDPGLMKEMDYQEVLNQQEIYGEELGLFSNKEMQKEVIVPKLKNEPLGVVIVESGWGSMVPTVVLANMAPSGAAARCGQLNIGDQIMSINGVSLVGLPLSSCQNYIKAAKNQTVVKLNVVSCPPVVEVLIKRPDVKYQLGFSVQNGVICSLLRGGIAERGGVRVGHRIIEINSSSVVAVPHEKIVSMLATSVGEIHMKTMPTSIFRLLTGQDTPHFM